MKIRYEAPPVMSRFMDSNAFVRAVVGPLGSGKSSGCVMEIPRRACEQAPSPDGKRRTRFAVIRNTRQQLEDTTRKTFEQWIPERLGKWNEQDFTFTMKFNDVICEVMFRALDRPKDVKRVLSLELTGAYLNEARELPKEVFDGLQGRVGRYPSKADGGVGASWFGVWMDTNPWHTAHWGYQLFSMQKPEGFELFEQPSGIGEGAENVANLPQGYYPRLCNGKDAAWIDEYVHGKYPSADKGSIFGELIARLEAAGRICDFEHPKDGVFLNLDLGISDSTALWFWRLGEKGVPEYIDWLEESGKPLSYFFGEIDRRGYTIKRIFLPHDARARTLQTGVSTLDMFLQRYPGRVDITPELSPEDGITAGRALLERQPRFHSRCEPGIERLRAYRYAWDEDKKVFSKKPLHDWTSHTSDSYRYSAVVADVVFQCFKPKEQEKPKPFARPITSFTLDELWETRPQQGGRI